MEEIIGGVTAVILLVATLVIVFIGGISVGLASATDEQQQAAIKAGVATWKVNPATGETRFEYVKCGEE